MIQSACSASPRRRWVLCCYSLRSCSLESALRHLWAWMTHPGVFLRGFQARLAVVPGVHQSHNTASAEGLGMSWGGCCTWFYARTFPNKCQVFGKVVSVNISYLQIWYGVLFFKYHLSPSLSLNPHIDWKLVVFSPLELLHSIILLVRLQWSLTRSLDALPSTDHLAYLSFQLEKIVLEELLEKVLACAACCAQCQRELLLLMERLPAQCVNGLV